MRGFIYLVLIVTFFCSVAKADYYIIDPNNNVVAKTQYAPDQKDLDTRQEISVFTNASIPIDSAEYRGGKITTKVETAKEKADAIARANKTSDENLIHLKSMKMACDQLVADGVILKIIKCSDFGK